MIRTLATADPEALVAFSTIIDVRSPAEFALDHVPGAINLPVLDDAERAIVGTIYVQRSRFEARRVGAALVARNIAAHIDGPLSDKSPAFAPLVYCWRGGQRSNAMATVLDQIGWRPTVLEGGYRTYRRAVSAFVCDGALPWKLILLSGATGCAKTEVLIATGALGAQVLDLEGMAHHRGSLLGEIVGDPQPSQKMFESQMAAALRRLDPSRPVLVEAESSRIGQLVVPAALWRAMRGAPSIELVAEPNARARYLAEAYAEWTFDLERLVAALERMPGRHGRAAVSAWLDLARQGANETLALSLIETHYDPAYALWSRKNPSAVLRKIDMGDLSHGRKSRAAEIIAAQLGQMGCP